MILLPTPKGPKQPESGRLAPGLRELQALRQETMDIPPDPRGHDTFPENGRPENRDDGMEPAPSGFGPPPLQADPVS